MIPKDPSKEAMSVGDLRPITLLESDYKIGSKALAWRLRNIAQVMISKAQRGFITGRDIRENVVLVQSLLQHKIDGVMIFIDWSKAYDRVDYE